MYDKKYITTAIAVIFSVVSMATAADAGNAATGNNTIPKTTSSSVAENLKTTGSSKTNTLSGESPFADFDASGLKAEMPSLDDFNMDIDFSKYMKNDTEELEVPDFNSLKQEATASFNSSSNKMEIPEIDPSQYGMGTLPEINSVFGDTSSGTMSYEELKKKVDSNSNTGNMSNITSVEEIKNKNSSIQNKEMDTALPEMQIPEWTDSEEFKDWFDGSKTTDVLETFKENNKLPELESVITNPPSKKEMPEWAQAENLSSVFNATEKSMQDQKEKNAQVEAAGETAVNAYSNVSSSLEALLSEARAGRDDSLFKEINMPKVDFSELNQKYASSIESFKANGFGEKFELDMSKFNQEALTTEDLSSRLQQVSAGDSDLSSKIADAQNELVAKGYGKDYSLESPVKEEKSLTRTSVAGLMESIYPNLGSGPKEIEGVDKIDAAGKKAEYDSENQGKSQGKIENSNAYKKYKTNLALGAASKWQHGLGL